MFVISLIYQQAKVCHDVRNDLMHCIFRCQSQLLGDQVLRVFAGPALFGHGVFVAICRLCGSGVGGCFGTAVTGCCSRKRAAARSRIAQALLHRVCAPCDGSAQTAIS